jgi:60 kDa SS-A/Ro ribonucleoprotein
MKINVPHKAPAVYTAQGGPAVRINPEQELRRSVAACMLWEDNFYEAGQSIADRIQALVPKCRPDFVAACAFEARTVMKLRHVPLLLVANMAKLSTHRHLVGKLLADVIQRADELTEYVAIHAKVNGVAPDKVKRTLSKQAKIGLAKAFTKFDEYQLAKYNRDGAVRLRDVLFLCHAKPVDAAQDALWKRLINDELKTPDTWEVALSNGADKGETFRRLMAERKLGALAYLRNMRNMTQAGLTAHELAQYAASVDITRVLPFRFLAAARVVPALEHVLEPMMLRACEGRERLKGTTVVMVDVSGSMNSPVSSKSDMTRLDAAYGVAILLRELCEDVVVTTFSDATVQVAPRRGFALRDAMHGSQAHNGTYLGKAVVHVNNQLNYDRLIVITDEQTADRVPVPKSRGYIINVASNKNGVGYGAWHHIDGWSEAVIDYVQAVEAQAA